MQHVTYERLPAVTLRAGRRRGEEVRSRALFLQPYMVLYVSEGLWHRQEAKTDIKQPCLAPFISSDTVALFPTATKR